jgi:hypothetical protein
VRVDQSVSALGGVGVQIFVCLRSSCNHVTDVGGPIKFARLTLNVVMQNDGDFVDVTFI